MLIADDPLLHHVTNGDPVTYTPPGGGAAIEGYAIFDAPGSAQFGAGELIVTEPVLRYPVVTFPAVVRNGVFAIAGASWRVREAPKPGEDGLEAVAVLERIA